jgi:hypothetical protein
LARPPRPNLTDWEDPVFARVPAGITGLNALSEIDGRELPFQKNGALSRIFSFSRY